MNAALKSAPAKRIPEARSQSMVMSSVVVRPTMAMVRYTAVNAMVPTQAGARVVQIVGPTREYRPGWEPEGRLTAKRRNNRQQA